MAALSFRRTLWLLAAAFLLHAADATDGATLNEPDSVDMPRRDVMIKAMMSPLIKQDRSSSMTMMMMDEHPKMMQMQQFHDKKSRMAKGLTSSRSLPMRSSSSGAVEPSYPSIDSSVSGSSTVAFPMTSSSTTTTIDFSGGSPDGISTDDDDVSGTDGIDDDADDKDGFMEASKGDTAEGPTSSGASPSQTESNYPPSPLQSAGTLTEFPFASASRKTPAPTFSHWSSPEKEWKQPSLPHYSGAVMDAASAPTGPSTRYNKPVAAPTKSDSSIPSASSPTTSSQGGSPRQAPPVSSPITSEGAERDPVSIPTYASPGGASLPESAATPTTVQQSSPTAPSPTTNESPILVPTSDLGESGTTSPTADEGQTNPPATPFSATTPTARSPTLVSSPTAASSPTKAGSPAPSNISPSASTKETTPTPHPYNDYGLHYARANKIRDKCGITSKQRSNNILLALSKSTLDGLNLVNHSTAQHEAFTWIDETDDALLCAANAALQQRYALAVIYFALNGREWSNCQANLADDSDIGDCETNETSATRWLSKESECTWYGVACDDTNRVTKLTLKANNLAGNLPNELFTYFPWMSSISLDHNKNIAGTIPAIMDFANLTYIELDDNALTGPFPDAFYSMSSLKAIDLNGNKLTGTISNDIGNLVDLMVLQLENNKFAGPLPSDGLAQLPNMLLLTLHGNKFTGSMEVVCAAVPTIRETSPEYLQFLSTDCADDVECSCCSACF